MPDSTGPKAAAGPAPAVAAELPGWARELVSLYESGAASQFILHGNVNDRMLLPVGGQGEIGGLGDFLLRVLMPRFDVILSYDLGNGIKVEKGAEVFAQCPRFRDNPEISKAPRAAVEALTHFFRYSANLAKLGRKRTQVGCIVRSAQLVAPAMEGGASNDVSAMALLIREWGADALLVDHSLATFLVTESLTDLHQLLVNNPRAARIKVPLPSPEELARAFGLLAGHYPAALAGCAGNPSGPAQQLSGATLGSVESLLRTKEYQKQALRPEDLVALKKTLLENDCNGLIEFIDSRRSLDALYGQDKIKAWLRQDVQLWSRNDLDAMPMGYLLCGPVGTGKTFMVECLAGEAGVPVVKLKNFRDKWVGSTEGNLEKIFQLLHALGRCYVFVDEADQALGKRDSGNSDSNLSGRIYGMIAEEMSNSRNRGRIVWILASSRPDLIEVDLKRPGRVDVKIPIFPTATAREGFALIRALCAKRKVVIDESAFAALEPLVPGLLTPGAAEALAVKVYRQTVTSGRPALEVLKDCLDDYQSPIPREIMDFQIGLAVREASDLEFVPEAFRAGVGRAASGGA
ncbi:MAG TPA: ATP-binding protein [Planctomycetota bacterium]|nr:ATP-binding protein [Planctomycetota bacterium]